MSASREKSQPRAERGDKTDRKRRAEKRLWQTKTPRPQPCLRLDLTCDGKNLIHHLVHSPCASAKLPDPEEHCPKQEGGSRSLWKRSSSCLQKLPLVRCDAVGRPEQQ